MRIVLATAITLSAALLAWKADIEARGVAVVVAEVRSEAPGGRVIVPQDTPLREVLEAWLAVPDFRQQFALMYATSIIQRLPDREVAFVLLNGDSRPLWEPRMEALLAHEFGHAWVKAEKYPTPVFVPGPLACLAIHTGDIVQHVLIRREMERRGIAYRQDWLADLERAIPSMESSPPPPEEDRCSRARLAAEWVDVRLALAPGEWPAQGRYEAAARRYMPEVAPTVDRIVDYVRSHNLADRSQHREALFAVFEMLKELADSRAKDQAVYGTLKKKRAAG